MSTKTKKICAKKVSQNSTAFSRKNRWCIGNKSVRVNEEVLNKTEKSQGMRKQEISLHNTLGMRRRDTRNVSGINGQKHEKSH